MCLILFAYRAVEDYPLVLVANRDEFFDRPTLAAAAWDDAPDVFAGRDLKEGGTWMGVSKTGRLAAVTNFREPGRDREGARSRGFLVAEYLRANEPVDSYVDGLSTSAQDYNGYNLLLWQSSGLVYFSNRAAGESREVKPGIHGLSNHLLDTPWPKVRRGTERLAAALSSGLPDAIELLDLVQDTERAPVIDLPDTGLPEETERALSSMFIRTEGYGTRSSSVVSIDVGGTVRFAERTFDEGGGVAGTVTRTFSIM